MEIRRTLLVLWIFCCADWKKLPHSEDWPQQENAALPPLSAHGREYTLSLVRRYTFT